MKMNRTTAILALMLTAAACTTACKQQELETTYSTQESRIDSFISSLQSSDPAPRVVHNNGSNRIVLTEGTGEELSAEGTVSFYYAGYIFSGSTPSSSNMFATNHEDTALGSSWDLSSADFNILTIRLGEEGVLTEGLRNGLVGVKGGEICYIVFSGKYGFGNKAVGTIPANSALIYQIWVESISNE